MRYTILIVLMSIVLLSCDSSYASISGQAEDSKKEPAVESGIKNTVRSIEFVNNRAFKDKTLRKKLDFDVGDYLDPILAEAYRRTLMEFYRGKGFAFVHVTLDKNKLQQGDVVYIIDEGPRVRVASVKFSGNKSIKTSALKNAIKTQTRSWFILPSHYIEERPIEDLTRLQNIYYERGFLDYKIDVKRIFSDGRAKVHITFEIEEGPVYTVGKIIPTGNKYFDSQKLLEGFKLKQGQAYNKQLADSHAKRILTLYQENGFSDTQVRQRPGFVRDTTVVNVEFNIIEGRQFRIGQVNITGNEQTQDKVIRRVLDEYDFTPGQLFNASLAPKQGGGKLEKYVQRMTLAEEVIISPAAPESGATDQKDINVDIKEGRTGLIMLSGGISSDSDIIGQLVWQQRNFDISDWPESFGDFITGQSFKGAGQSLRIAMNPGTQVSSYSVSFSEPYFRDKPTSLDVVGMSWTRWRESFNEQRTKGYFGFENRYKNKWRRNFGFRAENVEVFDLDYDAPEEIIDVKGNNTVLGAKFGFGRSVTDDIYTPSEGYTFNVSYEQATGDETFGILNGTFIWYGTLYEDLAERKTILATKLLAGTVFGPAQPFEKFYAGGVGIYGIRGFRYRGVSTRGLQTNVPPETAEREDPIGSDWIFLANTEATVPLIGENFMALFFVDSGTIDTGHYRASAGAGLQIMIPWLGPVPMRIGFASPFMKDDEDQTQLIFFQMGSLF